MQNTGLLRRFAAILYDCLLVAALLSLATVPFIATRGGEPVEIGENTAYRVILALVIFLFFTGYWTWRGRTLGMQSWGLQLETMDGNRPTFARASMRFFAAILSWAPLGLGFLWQLWDRDKLAWHDRISGTRLRYYPKAA
ncbi:MAG TPA: RDD family protein [Woeseiaceae bacterium]|nr:RDD family protein [Woeseiaceae bacterium]